MPKPEAVTEILIETDQGPVAVSIRYNTRAKRLTLRRDRKTASPILTAPPNIKTSYMESFLQDQADWIVEHCQPDQHVTPVTDGIDLPYHGQYYDLVFTNTSPRGVQICNSMQQIMVGGPADLAANRLEKFLKAEAKERFTALSQLHGEKIGAGFNRVGIGDMQSRWGSCSSRGTLKYNFRLIMAPPHIHHYITAHEVCHLLEMNHSPKFWAHVAKLCPTWKTDRKWLHIHGEELLSFQFTPSLG